MWKSRSLMILVSTVSLMAFEIRPAIAQKAKLPDIQTNCKTYPQARQPVFVYDLPPEPASSDGFGFVSDSAQISKLIERKQWDRAIAALQKQPVRVQIDIMPELLNALLEVNQLDRAAQFVVSVFPPKSYGRALGVGTLATRLIERKRVEDAIALLKLVSPTSESLGTATTPFALGFVEMDQLEKFQEIAKLFPGSDAQSQIWLDLANQELEIETARRFIAMIDDPQVRSQTQQRIAMRRFSASPEEAIDSFMIANEIEDCMIRADFFLDVATRIADSARQRLSRQQEEMFDQTEALLNAIDEDKLGDRPSLVRFRLLLAGLNLQVGRKAQGIKLLEQITKDQERFQFYADRAEILYRLANMYHFLQEDSISVRLLDLAVIMAQTALKNREESVQKLSNGKSAIVQWHDQTLAEIAESYRELDQPQKAAAVEQLRRPKLPLIRN